jgi:hypothetical protein
MIVKMIVEKQMECRLAWENLSSRRKPAPAPLLSITKSHMSRPGFEPRPPRWEAGLYGKLVHVVKKFPSFMEYEYSSKSSEIPYIGPYAELIQFITF